MAKPTVYVDANIFSLLHYRGADDRALKEPFFMLFASRAVENELLAGEYDAQERALAEVRRLAHLPYNSAVLEIRGRLLAAGVVPDAVPGDALQLAFATAHRVDYLLSWNRAHLVSEETQGRLARFQAAFGWRVPLVVSPATIPKVAFGDSIRRRD